MVYIIYDNNTHSWTFVGFVTFSANCDLQNVINIYNNNYTQISELSIYIDVSEDVAFNHTGISNFGELVWECEKMNSTTSNGNNIHGQSMKPTLLPVTLPTLINSSIHTTITSVTSDNNKNSSLFENETFIIVIMVTIGISTVVLLLLVLLCFNRKRKVNQSQGNESEFKRIHRMPSKSIGAPEITDGGHDVTIVYGNGATTIGVTNESTNNNNTDADITTDKNNKEDCLAYGNTNNIKESRQRFEKQTRCDIINNYNNQNKELAISTEGLRPDNRMYSITSDNDEDRNKLNEMYMQRLQPEGVVNSTQNEGSTK